MSYKFLAGLSLYFLIANAGAQSITNIAATPQSSAYSQDNQGNVARSQYGLCWRTGYWTPSDSITGCDGELSPPIANPIAPPLVSNPTAINSSLPTTSSNNCNFVVTLSGDQTFSFGMSNLNNAAKNILDREVIDKLLTCGQIDSIDITGHADRLGAQKQNQETSLKRAEAVATFLKSKNVAAPMQTSGAGNSNPITQCPENISQRKLTACLSPDRRVVISVQGHEK